MIKNKVSIERQINDRLYQFIVPNDASLSECLMIVEDIKKYVLNRIEEAEKQAKANEENPVKEV